jgi:hypothetical protein
MAVLIECPKCNRKQSTKNAACVRCGYDYRQEREAKTVRLYFRGKSPSGKFYRQLLIRNDPLDWTAIYGHLEAIYYAMRDFKRDFAQQKAHKKAIEKAKRDLADWYVKNSFVQRSSLKCADVPDIIVELARLRIIALREFRKHRKGENHGKDNGN